MKLFCSTAIIAIAGSVLTLSNYAADEAPVAEEAVPSAPVAEGDAEKKVETKAADNPLALFPSDLGVVVKIKAPQKTVANLSAYVGQIEPQAAFAVQFGWSGAVGGMLRNPGMIGIDLSADMYIGMKFRGQDDPAVMFAVVANDVEAMKAEIDGEFTIVEQDGWVVYTEDDGLSKSLKAGDAKSVSAAMSDSAAKSFRNNDIAAFVNIPVLRKEYASEIQELREQIEIGLDQLPALAPESEIDMGMITELYGSLVKNIVQGIDDADGLVVAVTVTKDAMIFEDNFTAAEGSPTAKFFARQPTSAVNSLSKLPKNQLAYFGARADMSTLVESGMEMMMESLDEEGQEKVKAMAAEMKQIKYGDMAGSMDLGNLDGGALKAIIMTEQTPTEKAREIARKYSQEMMKLQANQGAKVEESKYEADAESYGEYKADLVTAKVSIDEANDPTGMSKEIVEGMYGPDGMETRTLYMKDRTLQTIGGGKELMKQALAAAEEDADMSEAFAQTRGSLNKNANMMVLFDLPRLGREAARLFAESEQQLMPLNAEQIRGIELAPSFTGFSVGTEKSGARIRFVLPAAQVKGLVKLFQTFQEMQNPPQV